MKQVDFIVFEIQFYLELILYHKYKSVFFNRKSVLMSSKYDCVQWLVFILFWSTLKIKFVIYLCAISTYIYHSTDKSWAFLLLICFYLNFETGRIFLTLKYNQNLFINACWVRAHIQKSLTKVICNNFCFFDPPLYLS